MSKKSQFKWNPTVRYDVATDPTLSANAKAVYLCLVHHTGTKEICWPSDLLLGDETGLSIPTIQRALRELEGKTGGPRGPLIERHKNRHGRQIRLLTRDQGKALVINSDHSADQALPGGRLPKISKSITSDQQDCSPVTTEGSKGKIQNNQQHHLRVTEDDVDASFVGIDWMEYEGEEQLREHLRFSAWMAAHPDAEEWEYDFDDDRILYDYGNGTKSSLPLDDLEQAFVRRVLIALGNLIERQSRMRRKEKQ